MVRFQGFTNRDPALEAAGLRSRRCRRRTSSLRSASTRRCGAGDIETAFFQFVAEDVVATDFGDSLDTPNVVHGRNALLDVYRQVAAVLDDYCREVDEYVEVGDWVIAVGRWVGTGQASGVPVEWQGTNAVAGTKGRSSSGSSASIARRPPSKQWSRGGRRCRRRTWRLPATGRGRDNGTQTCSSPTVEPGR